jgi:hypothetical protein
MKRKKSEPENESRESDAPAAADRSAAEASREHEQVHGDELRVETVAAPDVAA